MIGEYADEAFSAYHGNRGPGLASAKALAVQAATEHERCVLVGQDADRFARGAGDAPGAADHLGEVYFVLRRQGVALWSVRSGELDLLRAALEGERATGESARKSQSVKAGLKRRADSGKPVGALPTGYRAETIVVDGVAVTRRVIDADEAALTERIFALCAAGHSQGDVSRTLNAEGVRTKRGKPWSTRAVRKVIENRAYLGENGYAAVIDAATWERAQGPKRPTRTRAPRLPDVDFVLGGLALCFHCGAAMRSRRCALTARRTYRCANAMEGRNLCQTSRPVPAEDAERELILNVVGYMPDLDAWLHEQAQGHRQQQANAEQALAVARTALQAVERRLERLLDDYERLPADEARPLLRRATKVEAERDEIERRVRDLEAVVAEHHDDPDDLDAARDLYVRLAEFARGRLEKASSPPEVRAAVRSLFEVVELGYVGDELAVAAGLRLVEPEPVTFLYRTL